MKNGNKKILVAGIRNPAAPEYFKRDLPDGFTLTFLPEDVDRDILKKEIEDADYACVGKMDADAEILSCAHKLKLIQKWGAGYDLYDLELIAEHGIPFMACGGVNAVQVAELTIGLLLAAYRCIPDVDSRLKAGESVKQSDYGSRLHVIYGKTAGVLGMGNIGKRTAGLLKAFGADVYYYDPYRLSGDKEKELGIIYSEKDELVRNSDILVIHVPLTKETQNLIDKTAIGSMKKDAVIVNSSRAGLVDEQALYKALKENRILAYATDVPAETEDGSINPLLMLNNVVATSHMGGISYEVTEAMVARCLDNIMNVDKGIYSDRKYFLNGKFLK